MDRYQIQEAFTVLKPLCDSLLHDPNIDIISRITEHINKLSNTIVQDLSDYILLPLIIHLQSASISKDIKEHLVKTVAVILPKIKIKTIKLFHQIYSTLLIQIYDKNQPNMVVTSHEELKMAVMLCLKSLLRCCFTEVLEALYTRENLSKLSQGIYISLSIAKDEKSISLRVAAIRTIMALCQVDDESERSDIILQNQVADTIMLCLPGIAKGLWEVTVNNDVQNRKITMMAIRAWGRIVSLIMQDLQDEPNVPSLNAIIKNNNKSGNSIESLSSSKSSGDKRKILETVKRTQEWLDAAAENLTTIIQKVASLKSCPHHKVRKELVETVTLLLTMCPRNMKPNYMELIDCLISLTEDNVEEVRNEAMIAINKINSCYKENQHMRPLIEVQQESFYSLLTKLPRIIRTSDDNEQLSYLNLVCGHLRSLGKQRLPHVMSSAAHMRRLLLALVYILEIDCSHVSLLEDLGMPDFDKSTHLYGSHSWKQYKFINNNMCIDKTIQICQLLAQFGDVRILVDSILELMTQAPQHRKESILLLNWIASVPMENESNVSLYKDIIDIYVLPEYWYLPLQVTSGVPLHSAQSNVIQCCLLTEGLGLIAKNLKSEYQRFLLKTLYMVVERAGSGHSLINYVGIQALQNIAESQGHVSIDDLLRANIDYISYHVIMKLRRIKRNPGVLDVVGIIMKYSTMDGLPCLKEIINDVFRQLNASYQKRNSASFLKIFYIFALCVKRLSSSSTAEPVECQNAIDQRSAAERIISSVLEYCKTKKIQEKIEEDYNETSEEEYTETNKEDIDDNVDYMENEEKKPQPPTYIKMIEDVMKQCLHYLPSKDVESSLMAMLALEEGLLVLAAWEDELLPIVHQLWHPLVDRFQDENVLIINRAWRLLCVVARVSKDFIRSRTLKQILPVLSKFLSDSAKESYKKDSKSVYKFTQVYKLQKELLSTLAQIAKDVKLHEREVWNILSIAEPYLHACQHPELQKYCVILYKDMADYSADVTWVKCLSIWNSKIAKIASDATLSIQDLTMTDTPSRNGYYSNVKSIITYIQQKSTDIG